VLLDKFEHGSFENENRNETVVIVVMEGGIRYAYWFNPIDFCNE
jgi:hypothetical protein